MMRQIFTLAIALCMLAFYSCKKNNDVPAPQPPASSLEGKVKTVTITASGLTLTSTFEYYPDGKIYRQSNSNSKMEYAYTDGFAAATNFSNGVFQHTTQCLLNAEGKAIIETHLKPDGTQAATSYNYTYNADKKIDITVYKSNGVTAWTRYYYYSGGNLIKDSLFASDGSWQVSIHDYYTDKLNSTEGASVGSYIYGAANKNCKKKISAKFSDGSPKVTDYGIPETDNKGRVIKQTQTGGGVTYTFEYTYY